MKRKKKKSRKKQIDFENIEVKDEYMDTMEKGAYIPPLLLYLCSIFVVILALLGILKALSLIK